MALKTIVVHADLSRHAPARIAMAVALATAHGAHLTGAAATGVSALVFPSGPSGLPGGVLDAYFGALRDQLNSALDAFERAVAPTGLSYDKRLLIDDAGNALAAQARYADLLVLSLDDRDEALAHDDARLPDYAIVNAPRAVLLVPATPAPATPAALNASATSAVPTAPARASVPQSILIAWNDSRQAAAAVGHALPLLQQARSVVVATFSEDHPGLVSASATADGAAATPGAALLAYLRRHGVNARLDARTEAVDMGHAILTLAGNLGADLIVAGCYGHSRLRELCLGGVSRTLLRTSPVALMMAHL
ncbi:universal stress protein [Massilia sp. DWR3-1-1]|uniref:universal stress protein n=1 Tax=Massilia sp. DWR3-1-1 TaxID=2804559 RepID=UPI003CEEE1E1